MILGTPPPGSSLLGRQAQSPRPLWGTGKSHGSQTSQHCVWSVHTFPNAFVDHVANVFVFEETAGRRGKRNSCLAVQQGDFAPFFSFMFVCNFFSDKNCMWFLGKRRSRRAGVRTRQSIFAEKPDTLAWGSPGPPEDWSLGDGSGQCFGSYVIMRGKHPVAALLRSLPPNRKTVQATQGSPTILTSSKYLKGKRNGQNSFFHYVLFNPICLKYYHFNM